MRVLVPTADYPPIEGGISTVTLQVARELSALGHEVTVVAPGFPDTTEFDRAEPYRVVRYPGYALGWFRFVPLLAACVPHLRSADLILGINIAYGGVIGMIASALFQAPYVTFAYAYEFLKFAPTSPFAALLRAAYRRSRVIVAISGFTRDALVRFGAPPGRIETILPGAAAARAVTPEEIASLKARLSLNGQRLVFAAGRMMPRKGHATLVRAMPRLLERHPDTVLVCAGRGPDQSNVARTVTDLGVSRHVRLPGRLSETDMATLYAICDVFALPSGEGPQGQVEGFGLVFAEAGAYGKPVVAGKSGGVSDAVQDGVTGLLVEPGDADITADAIARILSDADLAHSLGENGRQRVDRELNWARFTRRMLDAVEQRA